jgi:hypothetical protein
MLDEYNTSDRFWAEVVNTACHATNHQCDWRSCSNRGDIFDALRKFHRKILGCARLLIGCYNFPFRSDCDHDLVAFFGTLGFKYRYLLFPADVELYNPSCNINRGSGGTQEWPLKNERYLTTDIHFEYQSDKRWLEHLGHPSYQEDHQG